MDRVLAAGARVLVGRTQVTAASIVANATNRLNYAEHDNWDGGRDIWRLSLGIPVELYTDLEDRREELERQVHDAVNTTLQAWSSSISFTVLIAPALDDDPDWRTKVNQALAGEGITNQGRVRSDNIAARQHDGLLFRSMPEIQLYDALKRTSLPFAPLPVFLRGGVSYSRVEPDFVIIKNGLVMIVEVDGDLYHTETPAAAHARLKFITDEGAKLERIAAAECDTPAKATEAVARIIQTMDKLRRAG
ncbi:MAG: hypothetical protein ABI224_00205 [Acetobacteraceae bacterium]